MGTIAAPRAGRIERYDTVVIGAGQAGLAVGYHLSRMDVDFIILHPAERIGRRWRRFAERFELPVRLRTRVAAIGREDGLYVLETGAVRYQARNVFLFSTRRSDLSFALHGEAHGDRSVLGVGRRLPLHRAP